MKRQAIDIAPTPIIPVVLILALAACGPAYRKEMLGTGVAGVQTPRANQPVPVAIDTADEEYEVHFSISMPRALELQYGFECPGDDSAGTVGETWDSYRERRIAELQREQQQKRAAISSLGQAVGGAVLGNTAAGAQVQTPNAEAEVQAEVDGQAVGQQAGQAVAESVVSDQVELPPGDTGGRVVKRDFRFVADAAGACIMKVWSDQPDQDIRGVEAEFTVARVVDVKAEKRAAEAAAAEQRAIREQQVGKAALDIRASLSARLIAQGADPEKRAREEAARRAEQARLEAERAAERARREAEEAAERERRRRIEAQARAEREAERARRRAALDAEEARRRAIREAERRELRLQAEARARAAAELRARRIRLALDIRVSLLRWCIEFGADPNLRIRLAAQAEAEERRRRRRAAAEAEARRLRLLAIRQGSVELRFALLGYLQAHGADPEYLARLEAERIRAQRVRAEARQREADARAEARRVAAEARIRRRQLALDTRLSLTTFLRERGALTIEERQPPPAPVEVRPPAPFEGAIWVSGRYVSVHGTWQWRAGYWKRPPRGLSIPKLPAGIGIGIGGGGVRVDVDVEAGGKASPAPAPTSDHPTQGTVRDHRKPDERKRDDRARDHRRP